MADADIKEVKNQIWRLKQDIEKAEKERADWSKQIAMVQEILEADPNNADAPALMPELEEGLAASNETLQPLLDRLAELEEKLPRAPEPAVPKFDPEKHPLLKRGVDKVDEVKPAVFSTGDICEAQWTDKAWYKVKIQTILGSASAPKYHVRFLDYDDTLTVDRNAVRPLQSKRKRDEPVAAQQSAPAAATPHVISGPASVNPNAQLAKKDVLSDELEPKKRKIPNKKALEKGVNNWKNWNSKGVGKKISQKDSMFRSGTTVNSRVGFTGSGAGMTETNKRIRHNHKEDELLDDD